MTKTSDGYENEREERRRFVRVSISAVTRYFCSLRDMEVGVQTRISNISEGGALLETFMEGVPVDAWVKISFVMPGDKDLLITLEGIARHTGPFEKDLYRSGIEFRKVKEKDVLAIREYVASHGKKLKLKEWDKKREISKLELEGFTGQILKNEITSEKFLEEKKENPFYQKPQRLGGREPRSDVRQEIQAVAQYSCPYQKKEIEVQVRISNISEKGALFVTPKEGIPSGAEVRATIRLPGLENEPLTVVGKVKHVKYLEGDQYGSGIEFFDLPEKALLAIRKFVSTQQLGETL